MIKEDGTTINLANALAPNAAPIPGLQEDIENYRPISGRFILENGTVINLADLIASGQIPGGGGGSGVLTVSNGIISLSPGGGSSENT